MAVAAELVSRLKSVWVYCYTQRNILDFDLYVLDSLTLYLKSTCRVSESSSRSAKDFRIVVGQLAGFVKQAKTLRRADKQIDASLMSRIVDTLFVLISARESVLQWLNLRLKTSRFPSDRTRLLPVTSTPSSVASVASSGGTSGGSSSQLTGIDVLPLDKTSIVSTRSKGVLRGSVVMSSPILKNFVKPRQLTGSDFDKTPSISTRSKGVVRGSVVTSSPILKKSAKRRQLTGIDLDKTSSISTRSKGVVRGSIVTFSPISKKVVKPRQLYARPSGNVANISWDDSALESVADDKGGDGISLLRDGVSICSDVVSQMVDEVVSADCGISTSSGALQVSVDPGSVQDSSDVRGVSTFLGVSHVLPGNRSDVGDISGVCLMDVSTFSGVSQMSGCVSGKNSVCSGGINTCSGAAEVSVNHELVITESVRDISTRSGVSRVQIGNNANGECVSDISIFSGVLKEMGSVAPEGVEESDVRSNDLEEQLGGIVNGEEESDFEGYSDNGGEERADSDTDGEDFLDEECSEDNDFINDGSLDYEEEDAEEVVVPIRRKRNRLYNVEDSDGCD